MQEIIFACAKGLSLQLTQGQHQQQVKLDIAVIQVDNQLRFAVYPVLLSSTYPHTKLDEVDNSARVGKDLKPSEGASLSLLVAKWRHPAGSVDCFQCISVRLVYMLPPCKFNFLFVMNIRVTAISGYMLLNKYHAK